ncbi:IS200/IS605 family transposase [Planctellipticum variicoloris]|uniref:IS200/IS605 family transposase n=1 Tax=Planctellipticum variicoloris TaxID=3064265 RepID=UPI0030132664|nr:IS200/IS605 family transposase [Planctomycetaceae bacterium SH412]
MSSTYTSLHLHLVFSTKGRIPWITPEWQTRLHEYLGGTIVALGGSPQEIGGVADHVHLLVGLNATHRPCDVLQELKKASSLWVHQQIGEKSFAWQEGYAAFSVSPTARPSVRKYIANQVEHHKRSTFRDELIRLLTSSGIEYNPKFLD